MIVLAGVVAYLWPQIFHGAAKFNLYFFALTMFGIGAVMSLARAVCLRLKISALAPPCRQPYSFMSAFSPPRLCASIGSGKKSKLPINKKAVSGQERTIINE
jgi:hypothetical protein